MMLEVAYTAAITAALPFLPLRLWWRGRSEPLYRRAIGERFGFYGEHNGKPIIWVHAVSLGETRAAQPLIQALQGRFPGHRILTTHMTATGRAAASEMYPDALHAWLPYDHPWIVRRFLAHFRPRLGIVMETEVWPNLIAACTRASIPLVLANARLSERSARRYARAGSLARRAFGGFSAVGAQTEADANRIAELGGRAPIVTGNIKFDVSAPAYTSSTASALRATFGSRNVFLAASTRDGEEALLLDALKRRQLGHALVVVVPRHPQRFDAVADLIRSHGHTLVRRSEGRTVPADCRFFLGDSMGELAAFYRASDVAFVGGSLVPTGGQNLIEACDAGVPVLIGPSQFNFARAADQAMAAGAALGVASADELIATVDRLFSDLPARAQMGQQASTFCAEHRGATSRALAICERYVH
ncbi:MAG: lipid IV(A) 3-deoxy-D-manno-octulosonic acid transferase [Burkholderiales bacterium]